MDFVLRILGTGFSGIFVSGTLIPDSDRKRDSGFLELYSELQYSGFQISPAKISRIPESSFTYMGRPFLVSWNSSLSPHSH